MNANIDLLTNYTSILPRTKAFRWYIPRSSVLSLLGSSLLPCFPSFPQRCPFRWGSTSPSNTWFLGSTQVFIPSGISIGSSVFAQLNVECLYTLHELPRSPQKLLRPLGGFGPPFNTCFLGPTGVSILNDISISSAVFAWLTNVTTNRQTDQQNDHATPCVALTTITGHFRDVFPSQSLGLVQCNISEYAYIYKIYYNTK